MPPNKVALLLVVQLAQVVDQQAWISLPMMFKTTMWTKHRLMKWQQGNHCFRFTIFVWGMRS